MKDAVRLHVEPPGARDRLGALFRSILIIPHAILVGGPFVWFGRDAYRMGGLGFVAFTAAILDWFAIVFTGHALAGLQPLKRLYLCWRARVLVYAGFLRDEYPPFGDGPSPASLELPEEPETRDFKSVLLRLVLLVPHLVVLFALLVAALFVCIVSWVSIVVTGRLAGSLWRFTRDVMAYALRVEAYALLMHDRFPSFSLGADAGEPALAVQS